MAKLYDIDEEIESLFDPETGEITNEERLSELLEQRDNTVEGIALMVKNLTADAKAFADEKDNFAKKEKTAKNKAEFLKNFLANYLKGSEFKTVRVTVGYRSSKSVVVDDISALDVRFLKEQEPVANKTAIADAIKSGEEVPGAHIEEKINIQIK